MPSHRASIQYALPITCVAAIAFAYLPAAQASQQIKVTLFGQPCTLVGPVSEAALRAIHEISPERMAPVQGPVQTREALEKLKKSSTLPSALEPYRERLSRRLSSLHKLYEALTILRKDGKVDTFLATTQDLILSKNREPYRALVKRLAKEPPGKWPSTTVDQLVESFSDWIDPPPEEEFHRAIQRAKVSYQCTFEELEEGADEEAESDEPEAGISPGTPSAQ